MTQPSRIENELEHGRKIHAHAEDTWGLTSPAGQIRAQRRADFFSSLGRLRPGMAVLEMGCGTGLFTEKVSGAGADITAIDISPELLVTAQRKELPNCRFELGDAHSLSYSDCSFDIVFGSAILHHLDVNVAIREIHRLLKTGGRIIFSEPNMLNTQILVQKNIRFIGRWMGESPDETAFFRWKLGRQLQRAGFKNTSLVPYDFLHPATPRFLIPIVRMVGLKIERIPLLREIAGSLIIYGEK